MFERRLYEFAANTAVQVEFTIGLETLLQKSGATCSPCERDVLNGDGDSKMR
jgi:hypothetical protein